MNKLYKKIATIAVLAFLFIATFNTNFSMQAFASTNTVTTIKEEISPKADIIGWRYKTVGTKAYKRQFNYSKNQWIGDWILMP